MNVSISSGPDQTAPEDSDLSLQCLSFRVQCFQPIDFSLISFLLFFFFIHFFAGMAVKLDQ